MKRHGFSIVPVAMLLAAGLLDCFGNPELVVKEREPMTNNTEPVVVDNAESISHELAVSAIKALGGEVIFVGRMVLGVDLDGTNMPDAVLVHLRVLTDLEFLNLDGIQVTDGGLVHLKGLTNLEELWLSDTNVSDAGLEPLKELNNLNMLDLSGTQVTDEGVEKLQRSLPHCEIIS